MRLIDSRLLRRLALLRACYRRGVTRIKHALANVRHVASPFPYFSWLYLLAGVIFDLARNFLEATVHRQIWPEMLLNVSV